MVYNWIKENNSVIKIIVFIRKMVGSIKSFMYTAVPIFTVLDTVKTTRLPLEKLKSEKKRGYFP